MTPEEARVEALAAEIGPLAACEQLMGENNGLIQSPDLDNGRAVVRQRSAIHMALVRRWAREHHEKSNYDRPFAVAALGGTGRAEITPCSDTDFAFLFDDDLEENSFFRQLQEEVLYRRQFDKDYGFPCQILPFTLDDIPALNGKQLNSFLDLKPVYDPSGLTDTFRERIRATFDPFEHFLHVRSFWIDQWERAAGESERLDRFDIKNEGLRVFLAGVWTMAGREFLHSDDVYRQLDDPRDLEAYEFLLRIRSFVHLRKPTHPSKSAFGNHPEDVLSFEDFDAFGELLGEGADQHARFEFANEVRARLLSARRRVACFARAVIHRTLKDGREVSPGNPIAFGLGGLVHRQSQTCQTPEAKSRAALSLLRASQRYEVPIDPSELQSTFRNAGDWLVRVPELTALFYEQRGSLADSFNFLAAIDGAEERLFPGYAKFEASFDGRVVKEKKSLRGALQRQKLRTLEAYVRNGKAHLEEAISKSSLLERTDRVNEEVEAALLDADHLAAIKLALKTKRLPVTEDDLVARLDDSRPLHERLSSGISGIPLESYYAPFGAECGFPADTLAIVEFLVRNRRAYKLRSRVGINDQQQVDEFVELCDNENRLRALYVFTCADQADWMPADKEPTRWWNIDELYSKAIARFRPQPDPARHLRSQGFTPDQLDVLEDFGGVFTGLYGSLAIQFGEHLERLTRESGAGPKIKFFPSGIIGVATDDYRGLAASISGALASRDISLQQAHFFSAGRYGLALDFFHVAQIEHLSRTELTDFIADVIVNQTFTSEDDAAKLDELDGILSLEEWRPGRYRLRAEASSGKKGIIYALTYKVYRYLGGNIFGLTAHSARGTTFVSVYHSLPDGLSLEAARKILEKQF